MPNVIGKIPDFTEDTSLDPHGGKGEVQGETGEEEVKEASVDEILEEGKETSVEPPAEEKPSREAGGDAEGLENKISGLKHEEEILRKEISYLRGERRTLKQEELVHVQEKIDELKDLHPQDVELIERVLRSKGYVKKGEMEETYYKAASEEAKNRFLSEFPEYLPENDARDLNWNSLMREYALYGRPSDPHKVYDLLTRAHKYIQPSRDRGTVEATKRKVSVASVGGGSSQRSSSRASLSARYRDMLERGGFNEEDIKDIEQNLPE